MKKKISLTKHEEEIAYGAIHPDDIAIGFADVGGNEQAIERLRQATNILLTTETSPLGASRLFRAPSGILLYGPPGCGKTMIAKALAKESGIRFITVNLATIMDKWVGESEKYVEALFTLAQKISPVIVFVDEIDALTRKRGHGEREWSTGLKSQLLTFWDGLHSSPAGKIIVMGATNRPQDIDEAFLRRMPLQIKVDLPNMRQRGHILEILVSDIITAISTSQMTHDDEIDLNVLAANTDGFSGSDLHELARRVIFTASASSSFHLTTEVFLEEIKRLYLEKIECRNYNIPL